MLTRRSFLVTSGAMVAAFPASRPASGAPPVPVRPPRPGAADSRETVWHDVRDWGVEGRGWSATERYFDRLPATARGVVPDAVWNLSRHSAGMLTGFVSDADAIQLRYSLLSDQLAMPHMPATGVSGIDLYGRDGARWRWAAVFHPTAQQNEGALISEVDPGEREWRLYLPLYNGVESLEVGVPEGAAFRPVAPRPSRPVVFYGTSILHGACASRPGMAWPSIVGRRLDRPTINLGFSGNGRMEIEVARLLAELDASAYVIDCAPNMTGDLIRERAGPLVETIRAARPDAPIVLVEDRPYGYGWVRRSARERNLGNRAALRAVYGELSAAGVRGMRYVESDALLGADYEEAMTDGSHPNDMGMTRYADAITSVLREALVGG